jgi:hypothetical protein
VRHKHQQNNSGQAGHHINITVMASLSAEQTLQLRTQLHQAVAACNDRCLYRSAKWWVH